MRAHERPIARDRQGRIEVRFARDAADITAAVRLLDRAEARVAAPLVDEAERARLDDVTRFDLDPAAHWHPLVAWSDGAPVGYAGLAVGAGGGHAVGDLVVEDPAAAAVLFDAVRHVAGDHDRIAAEVWARHVDDAFIATAEAAGWEPHRRLLVLGRSLSGLAAPRDVDRVQISFHDDRPETDAEVAEVLAAAYAGTADGGWTLDDVTRRRGYEWFRPEDLLLARRGEQLLGVHWTKRRDDGTGEVYNLAVHPDAQGLGLGAVLLDAGLAHLASVGCSEVVLWVDAANEAGRRLYDTRGFTLQWQDVALGCRVC